MSIAKGTAGRGNESFDRLGFWALIVTQFQGAFSDNVYRWIIVLYAPIMLADDQFPVTALCTALFNLPWLLFPALAGALGDRFSKKRVTVWTKLWELGVMASGVVAVLLASPWLLFTTLFLMAMQSTFFSPAKYGIMPEILPESKLSWGNGQLNMWTFVAIILGTAAAGSLLDAFSDRVYLAMIAIVGFSLAGLGSSLLIAPVPPAAPSRRVPINPYAGLGRYFKMFYADQRLYLTMVGIAFFWFAGAVILQNVTELGKAAGASNKEVSYLLATMALGIGIGSLAAGYLSRGKIETGLIPLGILGMIVTSAWLAIPGLLYGTTLALLFLLGFTAGFFDVPFAAMLQERSPDKAKGGMIATSNFVTFSAMMVSSGLFFLLFNLLHQTPQVVFLVTALISAAVGIYICRKEPVFLLRTVLWVFDGTLVRLKVFNRHHLSEKGPALIVGNHLSIVEVLGLLASTDRDIHFLTGKSIYATPWTARIARMMRIIPMDPYASGEDLERVMAQVREILAQGHVVCVSQEKRLAPDGPTLPWHSALQTLTGETGAPVIPVHINRLWETLYTFVEGKVRWKWAGRWRYPIRVHYGAPLPSDSTGLTVREAIQTLGTASYMQEPKRFKLLHHGFIRMTRRHPRKMAMADAVSGSLAYFKALVGSIVFARKLQGLLDAQPMVGILVPPSVGGALSNIALQMMGKVPVNLNYTMPVATIASCAEQCQITQVLTSRKFLERLPMDVPGQALFLEDIRESVSGKDRVVAILYALFAPIRAIERSLGAAKRTENDLATIIFSSGSEGNPKGIMLSHRNIMQIIETGAEVFPHDGQTCLVGFLPFFHSFGYTVCLWLSLLIGMRAVYHANPLEPRVIGKLTQEHKGTFLIGTPTFLQNFVRRCDPEQLDSLEFVLCGAEKLTARVRNAFNERFGIEPMEGYGTTECAPAVCVNIPDGVSPGFYVHNTKHGSIGRPLPGQSVRIVNPDTGEPVPRGESGLLQAKGPNVMLGYLNLPEKTDAVIKDGWYSTGDIALIDDEGFITITDRLARFSKIGGEMVPHTQVEETLHRLLGLSERALAVAGVEDAQKGERLVVLHTLADEQLADLLDRMQRSDLPNLWRPRATAFHRIDAIPVLGTGKMDIKGVKRIAAEVDQAE